MSSRWARRSACATWTRSRRSSTASSAPRKPTRRSSSSRTSPPSGRRSSAARRARPSRSRPRAVLWSTRSWRSKRPRLRGVFERFTERARQVVVLAQDEARALRHNYIGTEHLLLGLLREEEGLGARVLESFGVTVEDVRRDVERIIGVGDEVENGQIPFTPRGKKVLELALREAQSLGHNHIGTEHILLGLARENEGVAARILMDHGASARALAAKTVELLGSVGSQEYSETFST